MLVGKWIWVVVPHRSRNGGYFKQLDQRQRPQRNIRDGDPPSHPFAFHPEPSGLLVWGRIAWRRVLLLDTSVSADPNDWPTRSSSRIGCIGPDGRGVFTSDDVYDGLVVGRPIKVAYIRSDIARTSYRWNNPFRGLQPVMPS